MASYAWYWFRLIWWASILVPVAFVVVAVINPGLFLRIRFLAVRVVRNDWCCAIVTDMPEMSRDILLGAERV